MVDLFIFGFLFSYFQFLTIDCRKPLKKSIDRWEKPKKNIDTSDKPKANDRLNKLRMPFNHLEKSPRSVSCHGKFIFIYHWIGFRCGEVHILNLFPY